MGNNLKITKAIQILKAGLDQVELGIELLENILLDQNMEIETLISNFFIVLSSFS